MGRDVKNRSFKEDYPPGLSQLYYLNDAADHSWQAWGKTSQPAGMEKSLFYSQPIERTSLDRSRAYQSQKLVHVTNFSNEQQRVVVSDTMNRSQQHSVLTLPNQTLSLTETSRIWQLRASIANRRKLHCIYPQTS